MNDKSKNLAGILARLDQAGSLLADGLPPALWRYYQSLLACGFKEDQALKLVEGLQAVLLVTMRHRDA